MTDGGVDWISKLPDSILHHILFFLDTKSAVQTCVLSKQWESAWKHVHALNLSLYFDECSRYETFVNNFLSFRHPLHVSRVFWDTDLEADSTDFNEFSLLQRVV
ncbi:F-box/LRR-repeat protein 13 [Linum grandiflorum]